MSVYNYSPLRYPGGKAKIFSVVSRIIRHNGFRNSILLEPFCGGAGVGLGAIFSGTVSRLVLNDADFGVSSFWNEVLNNSDEMMEKIRNASVNLDEWRRQKEILKNSDDGKAAAFATIFLNRCNHSGILNGGCIGGIKQTGKWKIADRFNRKRIIEKIRDIAAIRKRIEIHNMDVFEFWQKMTEFFSESGNKVIAYLDPPYWDKGKVLYRKYFEREQHERLADMLSQTDIPFILSYDNVDAIKDLYGFAKIGKLSLRYSAYEKKNEEEAFILSQGLDFPAGFSEQNEDRRQMLLSCF